jgi:hypothetical protein
MAGVARPTLNRVLRTAQGDGVVELSRGRVEIVDPVGLTRHAG